MKSPLYPPPLKKGDTVGIVAPAGQLQDETIFRQGVDILKEMGFRVKYPRDLWPGPEYLADSDECRGDEFNRLVMDDEINGLISMRGGYGCLRILDTIDLSMVIRNPKILVGFSDITILQNYLYARTGLISLHGPVVTSLGSATKETLSRLYESLTSIKSRCIESKQIVVLRHSDNITAPLIGGNLASLVTLLGTRYDFSWDNKIVFLEDTNEPAYKIDRMLTQLKLAGKFENIAGLILGDFSMSANMAIIEKKHYQKLIWNRVLELCSSRLMPIWGNFPSGHCSCNFSFPLGAQAEMTSGQPRLLFQ